MRLIDFAAGLIFASHGTIERVEKKVFMLTPTPGAAAVDSAARDGFLEAVDHMREDVTAPDQTGTETHQAGQGIGISLTEGSPTSACALDQRRPRYGLIT